MTQMDFILVFDVIILVLGAYIVYTGIKMKRERNVPTLFFAKEELNRCRDTEGLADYLFPRTMIFGGISAVFGVLGFFHDVMGVLPEWINIVMMVVFLGAWGWFSWSLRKGKEAYF